MEPNGFRPPTRTADHGTAAVAVGRHSQPFCKRGRGIPRVSQGVCILLQIQMGFISFRNLVSGMVRTGVRWGASDDRQHSNPGGNVRQEGAGGGVFAYRLFEVETKQAATQRNCVARDEDELEADEAREGR